MRILYLVTEDWYVLSHRLPVARAARAAGHEVVVAARDSGRGAEIAAEGFRFVPLAWGRGTADPVRLTAEIAAVARLIRDVRPDLIHLVAMKPILVGALARLLAGRPRAIAAFTGLGYLFSGESPRARLFGALARLALTGGLRDPRVTLLFQNADDRATITAALRLDPRSGRIIPGSGIETYRFTALPEPEVTPPAVATVCRMLRSKGVEDLVEASNRLVARGVAHRLIIAGDVDPESRESLTAAELDAMGSAPQIDRRGHVSDVRAVWAEAAVAVLAQRDREGLPKALLEAAASGRPLVATDVPGCREVCRDGETGLLVPPRDPAALADALERLLADAALRRRLGAGARALVEGAMSADAVARATVALYDEAAR